jgi:competence protein ComEC
VTIMEHVTIHFLNVGHGDCTLIESPSGRITMIDTNNSKTLPPDDEVALAEAQRVSLNVFKGFGVQGRSLESRYQSLLVDPCDYFVERFAGRAVFRYIQTHPDMDHMTGLYRFFWLKKVALLNFWDTANTRSRTREGFDEGRYDWNDWLTYRSLGRGSGPDGASPTVLHLEPGAVGDFYRPDGISVLGPSRSTLVTANAAEKWNNCSYILRLDYGGRRVILPGDAEVSAWVALLEDLDDAELACDILKAAHHGRETGYHAPAVEAMDPSLVICSVGKKPETDASDEYSSHGAEVLSTRYHGTIVVTLWADGEVWVQDANGSRLSKVELPPL